MSESSSSSGLWVLLSVSFSLADMGFEQPGLKEFAGSFVGSVGGVTLRQHPDERSRPS